MRAPAEVRPRAELALQEWLEVGQEEPVAEPVAPVVPGARLVVVEECGHMSTLERPEVVNKNMREWLLGN